MIPLSYHSTILSFYFRIIVSSLLLLMVAACSHDPSQVKVTKMGLSATSVGMATVEQDDTISEIADRYNVPMDSLIAANRIAPPYIIYPNQRLVLPPPRTYTVKPGDTIYEISRLFSTTQTRVVRVNDIPPPYKIRTGQVLNMPMPEDDYNQAYNTPSVPDSKPRQALKRKAKIAAPKLSGNGQFKIPVNGKVISSYGPKSGGLHNDGINIAASKGTAVAAAQNGVVAYVGDAIEGYGNLILLRHDRGYITAYAHLESVNVKRGDMVNKGQTLGTVGSTGSVTTPQLHFEIRKGTKALNPAVYL